MRIARVPLSHSVLFPSALICWRKARGSTLRSTRSSGIVSIQSDPQASSSVSSSPAERRRSFQRRSRVRVALDGNTVFEIGSVTKVFTTAILADMVQRGEVKLDDPISKFLPATVHVPSRGGKQITLLDLATQSSGLPRLPTNLKPANMANPYADYSVQQLYDFLSATSCRATSDPSSSTRISAWDSLVTFSRFAPARATRRS